jgi:hypothetical protein
MSGVGGKAAGFYRLVDLGADTFWPLARDQAFAELFPVLIIGPIAGAAADRWDRLTVVKLSQVMSLVQASAQ